MNVLYYLTNLRNVRSDPWPTGGHEYENSYLSPGKILLITDLLVGSNK
jgi:hypothetical protein